MSNFEEYFIASQYEALKGRDLEILDMRYGLSNSEPMTLGEIGTIYGITRERVRQLLNRAHRQLRSKAAIEGRKGNKDHPCAQFISYINDSIQRYNKDEDEAILDFVEEELAYLPVNTHSLPLINYLTIPAVRDAKVRLLKLRRLSTNRQRQRRTVQRQAIQLDKLLAYTMWPEIVKQWDKNLFEKHKPQRDTTEGKISISGNLYSKKLQREVQFNSLLERNYLLRLEELDDVSYYLEQPLRVQYEFDGQQRIYYPDVFFLLKDGRGIVVEIKPIFQMALAINLAKWKALRQFCASKGFGLIVTDGKRFIQQILNSPVRQEVMAILLKRLEEGSITWKEYNTFRQKFDIKRNEFIAFILKNRLYWKLSPFLLSMP